MSKNNNDRDFFLLLILIVLMTMCSKMPSKKPIDGDKAPAVEVAP